MELKVFKKSCERAPFARDNPTQFSDKPPKTTLIIKRQDSNFSGIPRLVLQADIETHLR